MTAKISSRFPRVCMAALITTAVAAGPAVADRVDETSLAAARDLTFDVFRKDSPLGTHSIDFTRQGDQLIVDVEIQLEYKLAFLTLYRYEHSNREVWQDGQLLSIETKTDNNGESHWVRGAATDAGFKVTSDRGVELLPADVIPSSYWHPKTPKAQVLLNTQTGELAAVTVTPDRETRLDMPWGPQTARAYRVSGDIDLNLWYDPKGCLLKLNFAAPRDGALIDYKKTAENGTVERTRPADYPLVGACAAGAQTASTHHK